MRQCAVMVYKAALAIGKGLNTNTIWVACASTRFCYVSRCLFIRVDAASQLTALYLGYIGRAATGTRSKISSAFNLANFGFQSSKLRIFMNLHGNTDIEHGIEGSKGCRSASQTPLLTDRLSRAHEYGKRLAPIIESD